MVSSRLLSDVITLLIIVVMLITPIAIGFAWILPDANRRGQPGALWAILTLPLGWLAVLGYLIARTVSTH